MMHSLTQAYGCYLIIGTVPRVTHRENRDSVIVSKAEMIINNRERYGGTSSV